MRAVNGMHAPNAGTDPDDGHAYWSDDAVLCTGAGGSFTTLMQNLDRYAQIRQLAPEIGLFVRLYPETAPGARWSDLDSVWWADYSYNWLKGRWPQIFEDPYTVLFPCNEPDLAVEGYSGGATETRNDVSVAAYQFIWIWQIRWINRMRQLLGSSPVLLGTGPLADGHESAGWPPDSQYTLSEAREAIGTADILLAHAYGLSDLTGIYPQQDGYWHGLRPLRSKGYKDATDPGGCAVQFPSKPFAVVEFGNWRHSDVLATQSVLEQFTFAYSEYSKTGRCLGITPFLWDSGPEHGPQRISRNPDLVSGLKNMARFPAPVWPKPGENMVWDRHTEFDAWNKAFGGQGYNPSDAFGKIISANPDKYFGAFVGPYRDHGDLITGWTTVGIFWYDKRTGTADFATAEAELPNS